MKSKKQLFNTLAILTGRWDLNLNSDGISNETYGKDSRIYLWNVFNNFRFTRQEIECVLHTAGFKVHRSFDPGTQNIEVSVSYFKGRHWDE